MYVGSEWLSKRERERAATDVYLRTSELAEQKAELV